MHFLILFMTAVVILIPLYYAGRVLRLAEDSKIEWLITIAETSVFVALVVLVARWDITGYYTRNLLLVLFLLATAWSFRTHLARPWRPKAGVLRRQWRTLASLFLFCLALFYVLSGMVSRSDPRSMGFPLSGGRFVAAQAGGIGLLNHHADHPEQGFAIDFTAIYPAGFRARGVLPEDLTDYAIFGATVISPCTGKVIDSRVDLPDLIPPNRDPGNAAGNHVTLVCGDLKVVLAHFMQNSVAVKEGDQVAVGEPLGKVGNSGNTTEPHLHIHAVDVETGRGVPIAFAGRFPVRNNLFR